MATVNIATVRAACNTSTGTQDFTTSNFGGGTPTAALFFVTSAVTDAAAANNAHWGIGATDGTRQWSFFIWSAHNTASTDVQRRGMTDQCVCITNANDGSVDGEAAFSSFITNGVRINWGNAPAGAFLLTVVLFGGADLSVRVDTINLGTVTTAQTYASMGFEADVLICAGHNFTLSDTTSSNYNTFFGLVHNNGAGAITQRSMGQVELDAQGTAVPDARMMEDKFGFQLSGLAVVDHEYTASNFSSTGFQFTSNASAVSDLFGFIGLKFGGLASAVGTYAPPVTATTSTISTSFTPQFCLLGLNGCTAVDTAESDADAGPYGVSVMDPAAQYCNAVAIEDNSDPTDTQSMSDDQAIKFPAHDGASDLHAATLVSMDSSGVNLTYSTASATSRKWIYLAVEQSTVAGGQPAVKRMGGVGFASHGGYQPGTGTMRW